MNPSAAQAAAAHQAAEAYLLRFESLFHPGRALTFPCDAQGRVALDRLSEPAKRNYLYARALLGRDYATPAVVPRFSD